MEKEPKNKQVAVFLQGKLKGGEVFEETPPDHPVVITLGSNNFFPDIEKELFTMKPGETRTFTLAPEQAYGPHHENLVQKVDRSIFGNRIEPKPGMILSLSLEGEGGPEKVPATVVSVSDEHVTVDYNHPLAGREVTYVITVERWLS
jgi:FKBP-type peptidyl-prolyl cis-trans isomerase 2